MLTEYLGIRDGAPNAGERRAAIEAELRDSPDARAELRRALREHITNEQSEAAIRDLAYEQADHQKRTPPHDAPPRMTDKPGERVSREQLRQFADVAQRLRHLVSQRTLAKFRAQRAQHPGTYPRIDGVMIGGGASLAGRDPGTLLVDARGRWQADGSENLAQVGQQLQDLYRAKFGDVREVAGPGERIPIEAIRYWEDSLAAQGEVIDGKATLRTESGKLLVDIVPTDGSGAITLEVGGTVTTAPGFPDERFLAGDFRMPASEAFLAIEQGLRTFGPNENELKTEADALLRQIAEIKTVGDADLSRLDAIQHASPELIARIKSVATDNIGSRVQTALNHAHSRTEWDARVSADSADGERQLFSGKEGNPLDEIKNTVKRRDDVRRTIVIAGTSGNAVSAAEIILDNTRNAHVVLVGRNTAPGLFRNGQFRSLAERYGDEKVAEMARADGVALDAARSTKRMQVIIEGTLDFTTPEVTNRPDGTQAIELRTKKNGQSVPVHESADQDSSPIVGDMLIGALGSQGQLPPNIATLAMEARRLDPANTMHPDPRTRPVWVNADFAQDGRYLGYSVYIRIGGAVQTFEVRGAASRSDFVPVDEFRRMGPEGQRQLDRMNAASNDDAPAKSGNFTGGFGPTATQTSQQHVQRGR